MITEERGFNRVPVKLACIASQVITRILVEITPGPCAVGPWSHDQGIGITLALGFDGPVGFERSEKIFCIKPATNNQCCRFYVLQVDPDISLLPVTIVGIMCQVFLVNAMGI